VSDDLSIPNPGYRGNRTPRYSNTAARRRPAMDPDTKRLLIFAGGVGGVLGLLIAASAITGRHSGQIPVVAADTSPIRIKPVNPGGLKVDAAENDVFSGGTDTGNARLAPAAEMPDTKALRAAETPPAQAPAKAAIPAPAPETPPQPAPATAKPLVPEAAKPLVPPASRSLLAAAAAPSKLPPPKPLPEAEPRAAANGHTVMVQLAAMTTDAGAREEWQRLAKRYPDLFGGRDLIISRTERDGHAFWRVRTSGFADLAQARAFCDKLRAKGAGCSIVDF